MINTDFAQRDKTELSNTADTDTNIVVSHGSQVGVTLCPRSMFRNTAKTTQQEASGVESLETAEMDDMDIDNSIDNEAQVSATKKLPYIVKLRANNPQLDFTKKTDTDTRCVAVSTCLANSGDHRKIVSHIFGRNKTCTRELPRNLWIFWCRKHYQRFKYRAEKDAGNWHIIQLGLVRKQLQIFEDWGQVHSWTITLRKAEQNTLAKEDKNGTTYTNNDSACWERFLVPFLGPNKTFAKVREVLAVIEREFDEAEYRRRDKKLKPFPGIEFLPTVQKVKVVKKPAAKKGELTYKKITLDQPAFNRKTRANAQYIREKAAKEAEASKTPKRSLTASEKDKSPDTLNSPNGTVNSPDGTVTVKRETPATDDGINVRNTTISTPSSKATKRKSVTSAHKTPRSHQHKTPPTKYRRLMRGYEKHGTFNDEITTLMKKEKEGEGSNDA